MTFMADTVEAMLAEATNAGAALVADGTLACNATYDPIRAELQITLANGARVNLPAQLIDGLRDAPDAARSRVEVSGIGYGLHWPDLDLDLSVPALLAGIFGTRRWLDEQRARTAGRSRSPAKGAASRSNGAKGGRPRKS
jgi:hypothetical protein